MRCEVCGGSGSARINLKRTAPTPVLMVAMDCGCSERRPRRPTKSNRERKDGADVYRSQARKKVFRDNQGSGGDAEPHRGSEGILRPIPSGEGAARRPPR